MTILVGTNGSNLLNGSTLGDLILGGLGNDSLNGLSGDDSLFGGRGADRLSGGAGDDSLAGGLGADLLLGGAGSDVLTGGEAYFGSRVADNARDVLNGEGGSDVVVTDRLDLALGGNGAGDIDTLSIRHFESVTVRFDLDLRQIGTADAAGVTYGYGTARAAQFESAEVNLSNAEAGSVIRATNGNDFLFLGIAFDPLSQAGGTIHGFGGNDRIGGSSANDTIFGGAGNDVINAAGFAGSGGSDRISGGAGADIFIFNTPDQTTWDADRITDFQVGVDRLFLVAPGFIGGPPDFAATLLVRGADPVSTAAAGLHQLLYDTDDGRLFVDINGSTAGGVVHLATLTGRPPLTAADLHVEYNL